MNKTQLRQLNLTCCEKCCNLFIDPNQVSFERNHYVIKFSRHIGELYQSADQGCPFCTLLSANNVIFTGKDWNETCHFLIRLNGKEETMRASFDVRTAADTEDYYRCTDISRLLISSWGLDKSEKPCTDILVSAKPSTYNGRNLQQPCLYFDYY